MDAEYSFSLTTFSPSGKLVQLEHAIHCVANYGYPALGIKAADGVVLATQKNISSPLWDASSYSKIDNVSENIGFVFAGMPPDYRVILRKSRKQGEAYHLQYNDPIPVGQLVRESAAIMQEMTQSGGVRPFGVSLLVAGYDHNGPQLYQVDPSGAYFGWKASAIGKNFTNAKSFLEKRYKPELGLDDAIHIALLTLQEGFEGAMNENNIEVGVIREDKKFTVLTPSQIKDFLEEVNT